MPGGDLDVVAGDPESVAATARTLSSIADDVARHANRLRALASSGSDWTGKAASTARARSATLPPKLDKVTASYGSAGNALLAYATALADAQQRSRSAVASFMRADDDLRAARAAQEEAAAADSKVAAAAAAAGVPAPAPTAVRYQASVDDAAARVRRARAENEHAHADRDRAARAASARLKSASHEGIRNQSWWRHVTHAVGHWASTQWRYALAELSAVAGQISVLAGIAAVVCAIGGLFFPPLEVAAAALEDISLVSGVVANASAAIVELSDKHSRKEGLVSLGFLLMPAAAKRVTRRVPVMGNPTVLSAVEHTEGRTIPLGFENEREFKKFSSLLHEGFAKAGYPDAVHMIRGSAVTGVGYKHGLPFDFARRSDLDLAVADANLFGKVKRLGIELRTGRTRTGVLTDEESEQLGLRGIQSELNWQARRIVTFMVYKDVESIARRGPCMRMPQ